MNCCLQPIKTKKSPGSKVKAHLSIRSKNKATLKAVATIKPTNTNLPSLIPTIKGSAKVDAVLSIRLAAKSALTSKAKLRPHLSQIFNLSKELVAQAEIKAKAAKFAGDFRPNDCYDKLYPTQDLEKVNWEGYQISPLVSRDGYRIISRTEENIYLKKLSLDLYSLIDEGVYAGDYHLHEKQSDSLFSYQGFIKSSDDSDHTKYTTSMSLPSVSFTESYVVFNAQAFNSKQKIYEIEFRDEEDNLICEYEDIEFVGDNYPTMYSSKPRINNGAQYTWSAEYPKIPSSGCTLSFKTQASCIEDADGFDDGFDQGFERCSTLYSPEIRISAVEICNSGDFGFRHENFLPVSVGVREKGDRLTRKIEPSKVLPHNFSTDVWPEVQTIWENTYGYSNLTEPQGRVLANDLSKPYDYSNITLTSSSVQDSGKLNLLFEHKPQEFVFGFNGGAFGLGFDHKEFEVGRAFKEKASDDFFVVDEIYLKIRAKKEVGSRDYALDVVGWSDDNLLNVTSQVGGFLQNTTGTGVVPVESGWNNLDNEGISSESLSEQDEYYEHETVQGHGSDHYKLSPTIVDSTGYRDYEVPLVIEVDEFKLGLQDRSSASFFEKLFLDIYPLPSGASISSAELCVKYTPSNALQFTTLAGGISRIELDRKEGKFFPTTRTVNDLPVNREATSLIESVPHGYESPATLKSNYARRWRGVEGITSGPFDTNAFDFGFESHQLDSPFLLGHFDFTNISGDSVFSRPMNDLSTTVGTSVGISAEQNVGFRFKSPTLVNTSNTYQSIDWNGKTVDAYDSVTRLANNISFPAQDFSEGFAFYLRFSPDENATGTPTVLLKDGVSIAFNHDTNQFSATVSGGGSVSSSAQPDAVFPASVVFTYNDAGSGKAKLYVKYENKDIEKSQIPSFSRVDTPGQILVAPANNLYHEIGISAGNGSGVNLVDGDEVSPNPIYKQQTVQSFLNAQSVHWTDSNGVWSDDSYVLPSYIDGDTLDWNLGAFNWKQFTPHEFEMFTQRIGKDAINFRLVGDGVPYVNKTDLPFPSTIDSAVSYHTQIENDFLRINLTDSFPNFYSASPRIAKALPRGYHFDEKSIVVDSIISYAQSGEIVWPDGNVGPKLIVSVYTRNQEDEEIGTHNWGLVNRKSHYLNPNNRWSKLETTFDLESLLDESEKWSVFPEEKRLSEFNHRYFSKDADEMFLQYDLVTPSGDGFEINLNIHSANLRMENAFVKPTLVDQALNVFTSGEFYSYSPMPLYVDPIGLEIESMNLYMSGVPTPVDLGAVNLSTSGAYFETSQMSMHLVNKETVENSGLPIATSGNYRVEAEMNLVSFNDDPVLPSEMFLPLHMFGSATNADLSRSISMTAYSSLSSSQGALSGVLPMKMVASRGFQDVFADNAMPLFTDPPTEFGDSMNLVLFGRENEGLKTDSFMNLYNKCFPAVYLNGSGDSYISWNNRNVGRNTEEIDEGLLTVPSIDLIRGTQTICWGDCSAVDDNPCVEQDIITHDTNWANKECVDGGILRPSTTYSNSETLAFGGVGVNRYLLDAFDNYILDSAGNKIICGRISGYGDSYKGHFYGSRKYQGLFPNTPYTITVVGKTGDKKSIALPPKFEEWEYGTLGDIDFEGFKHVAEERHDGDLYGKCVKVKGEIMGVGAPGHDLGIYKEAGAIFLYRRQEEEGGEKKPWDLETKLTLPSGFIGDWYYDRGGKISFPGIGTIPEKQWNIGQEGRELGHSFDIAVTKDREVIVAGGPGAKWDTRGFEEIETSGVNVAIMVFNNEFSYDQDQIKEIMDNIDIHNFLYKHFAEPAVNINLKIISCIPTGIFDQSVYTEPGIENLIVGTIPRAIPSKPEDPAVTAEMLSGIKSSFFEAFPYDETQVNNNIPPIVGFYVDNSRSLGRPVVEPAIDQFVNFYKNYSFQSGVRDFYDNPASGYIYEYTPTDEDQGEDWFKISNNLVNNLLDTGNLYDGGHHTLITSGIGLEFANEQAIDFNLSPESGGRVYVFEKEFGDWSLMQEIKSPVSAPDKLPARFGHAVSISDDASVFSIGSPFIRESCSMYQFADGERNRLYDNIGRWLKFRNDATVTLGQYYNRLAEYQELEVASGVREAGMSIYADLSRTDKFKARSDYDFWRNNHIQEYRKVFKYGLDDIERGLEGTFTKTMRQNAPNPRLGYSTAVSEDGQTVAFGAPTDSIGQYEDAAFYFLHKDGEYLSESGDPEFPRSLWASNVNAGAVRMFEKGQDFEPISERKALEYNKFGNLSNTINNTEGYDDEGNETNSTAISQNEYYDKTDFGDVSIPKDVGSIFIITPEIDAANDEVIEEIKQWMSLGDRRLVLVGDDPVWEKNGAYAKSNEIINKILDKLDSRMRLHPARNEREALIANTSCSGEIAPNVIKSYKPQGSNSSNIEIENHLFGYGVADIRLHVPDALFKGDNWGKDHSVVNNKRYGNCSFYSPKCGPPITHNGDLRARWIEREIKFPPDPEAKDPYTYWERNLPFEFYSNGLPPVKPKDAVDIAKDLSLGGQGEQPRPLMVAAEFTENYAIIPAKPEVVARIPITETTCFDSNSSNTYYLFDDNHVDDLAFYWMQGSGNQNSLDANVGNNQSEGRFYDPQSFNERDALLQADGTLDIQVTREELTERFQVGDPVNYVAKESISGSDVYLIAGTDTENQEALTTGNDENISFYDNLVRNANCDNAFIIQLGGWTGRDSFASAGEGSLLDKVFEAMGHNLVENWDGPIVPASKDVLWIANTDGEPTSQEVSKIKTWLALGGKKLVITYDKKEEQSSKVYRLCESLGLGMKPWYLSGANVFPTTANRAYISRKKLDVLLDEKDQSIISCDGEFSVENFTINSTYCPIDLRSGGKAIVWQDGIVKDERLQVTEEYEDVWSMNTGVAKIQFPATPGSGYRIFYNWIADRPEEKQNIDLYAGDVLHKISDKTRAGNPDTLSIEGRVPVRDYDENRDLKIVDYASTRAIKLESPSFGTAVSQGYLDVQVPSDKDYLNLFFTGNRDKIKVNGNQVPTTYKLLSVSGAPLPINEVTEYFTSERCETREIGFTEEVTQEYVPPKTVLLPATIKPIMNDNTRYCLTDISCGGKLVADGPVVIAEEPEHFSDGATGNSRSKILLISDSTIVNGCLEENRTGEPSLVSGVPTVPNNTMLARVNSFLNSLTTTETTLVGDKTELNLGYKYSEKIVSPEKGSPAIYSLIQSNMGAKFGGFAGGSLEEFGHEKNYDQSKTVQNVHEQIDNFEKAEKAVLEEFGATVGDFCNPRFTHGGYTDSPMSGDPFSTLLRDTGKDFLDYDSQSGSYPGDLFGHSLDIHNGKLIVGSPYSAYTGEEFSSISGISGTGKQAETGNEGGGGSSYVFEKTVQFGWEAIKKLKPEEVRSFDNSDRFGWSVSMDGDFAAISAPGHDFGNSVEYTKGAFVRKEFSAAFDIGTRSVSSLGPGETPVSNNIGAIFTFENRLYDWSNRAKDWTFAEKLVPYGYASGEDTSSFGNSVSISRFARRDSDYAMSVGSHRHTSGLDGSYDQESGAGASYAYDAMLRNQPPATFSEESWLKASIFGLNRELDEVNLELDQLGAFNTNEEVIAKGLIYSDAKGQIFLEASGQDPRELSFIVQRPYIERIEGEIVHGTPVEEFMPLTSYTDPFDLSGSVNLFMLGQESDIVYNNLDLFTYSAYSAESGVSLLVKGDAPTLTDNSLILYGGSGYGVLDTNLDLRVRGK